MQTQIEYNPALTKDVPAGFSAEAWEIVQKKPTARIIDVTAGNRHIWGKEKMRDDVIFTDKEPRLKIPPDLLTTWQNLPNHFPADYFHCAIFDPPHLIRRNGPPPWFKNPQEPLHSDSWYGWFESRRDCVFQLIKAQQAFSIITPRLCLKWYDDTIPIENILGIFTQWSTQYIQEFTIDMRPANSKKKRDVANGQTWWVKLVRRTVDDKDGTGKIIA